MNTLEQVMKEKFDAMPEAEKEAIQQLVDSINNRRGEIFHMIIEHDDGCPKMRGGECCCQPTERFMNQAQFEQYLKR